MPLPVRNGCTLHQASHVAGHPVHPHVHTDVSWAVLCIDRPCAYHAKSMHQLLYACADLGTALQADSAIVDKLPVSTEQLPWDCQIMMALLAGMKGATCAQAQALQKARIRACMSLLQVRYFTANGFYVVLDNQFNADPTAKMMTYQWVQWWKQVMPWTLQVTQRQCQNP
jgi:hypothetical protein